MKPYEKSASIPEGVTVTIEESVVKVAGAQGELSRDFKHPQITVEQKDGQVVFKTQIGTSRVKTQISTNCAHVRNMCNGVLQNHTYKLKICSGHFPMNVALSGNTITVKNFLGGKVPRSVDLDARAKITIDGDIIEVSSPDIEVAGNVAARIEKITRITNKDLRIYQDGIYIIKKAKDQ